MKNYNATSIKIFEGLDAVRKRPGMYIGNTDDGTGLHRLIFEVVDNSIDESMAGFCSFVRVILMSNGFVSVFDDGRGMPVDMHIKEKKSAAEVIMTVLHSGAKFDEKVYKISGGLHGVGVSVVNALSSKLRLRIFRSGFIYEQIYCQGKAQLAINIVSHSDKRGTEVSFLPDNKIFLINDFNYNTLLFRFKELSLLNYNVKFLLLDYRSKKIIYNYLCNDGGLKSFLTILNKNKSLVTDEILYFFGKFKDVAFKVAFQWVHSFREHILCYTNNIYQKHGGTHLIAFKSALVKVIKVYLEDNYISQNNLVINSDDIKDGLVAIFSLYMKNPKFSSQIKDKLISSEVKKIIENIVYFKFKKFLYENPSITKLILNKIFLSAKTREAIRKAKNLSLSRFNFDNISFLSKLADCQESNPAFSELFLVEGDSAGGSAKQARDRRTQAILPLKGKILNVEKADFEKITSNSEILSLVNSLNCGIGRDSYNEKNLRYHKIILMTDADVDGAHIRTLLMTFFYRYIPQLIKNNHVFISRSPLYKFSKGSNFFYIKDKCHLDNFLFDSLFNDFVKNFNIDKKFLTDFFNIYKLHMNIIDKYSTKYPLCFLDKLVFLISSSSTNLNGKNARLNLYDINHILKKFGDITVEYFFTSTNEKEIFKFSVKKFGFLKDYIINFNFLDDEIKLLFDFNLYLKKLFDNYNSGSLTFNKKKYHLYNFYTLIKDLMKTIVSGYSIQRYKGLGEMNPSQLWETTMNPSTRNLQLINIKDFNTADAVFTDLMGNNIINRKKIIRKYAHTFLDLDF